jgi:8-oxo-dGTP pyrophosphatase MutT (NUDIX family)
MKEYIKELRSLVGSRPLIMCGASVIIYDREGKVLMLHRSDNDCWCFPGGAVEMGEKVEEAAAREVWEEMGLTVGELKLFGVFSGKELYYKYPNGDEVFNVDVVFTCDSYSGEITINSEGKGYRFFEIGSLPREISPPVRPVVDELVKSSRARIASGDRS